MSTDDAIQLAQEAAAPPFLALSLYGSYARGDYDQSSDIDVLQVTALHTAPYSVGKVNITCYTLDQLISLAKGGSLFFRHFVSEAVDIYDPTGILRWLKSIYVVPRDYEFLRKQVVGAMPLVTIVQDVFEADVRHYAATASYLLRSYVYAKAFDLGATSFSMQHVLSVLGDRRPREVLSDLKANPTYVRFRRVVGLLCELTDSAYVQRNEPLEAFVVNSYGVCDLAVVLGLRVLARGNLLTYTFIESSS